LARVTFRAFDTRARRGKRRYAPLWGIVGRRTSGGFLSTAFVVLILACVALLAVASAVTLVPFARFGRRRGMVFMVCLAGIWALATLVIVLIRRAL
jgi:hypothetical protein